MNQGNRMKALALSGLAASLMLTACGGGGGGGGGSADTSGTAEGLWIGTTDQNRTVAGLVLSDGSYWFLYSAINDPTIVGGLVQGGGTSSNSTFQSSNAKDFNLELPQILSGTFSGNYVERRTLDGTATAPGVGSTTFNLDYDAAYELVPSLGLIAGTYSGWAATAAGIGVGTIAISGNGTVTPVGAVDCQFTGTVTPRPDANAYDLSVTFGGGLCSNGTSTVTGVAFLSSNGLVLYTAALNTSRTDGFVAFGSRL